MVSARPEGAASGVIGPCYDVWVVVNSTGGIAIKFVFALAGVLLLLLSVPAAVAQCSGCVNYSPSVSACVRCLRAACVRKSWAETNRDLVVRFIRAYAKGVEAMYDPKNRLIVEAILVANAAGMTPELAAKAYDIYVNDKTGFFKRPVFGRGQDRAGVALKVRRAAEDPDGRRPIL